MRNELKKFMVELDEVSDENSGTHLYGDAYTQTSTQTAMYRNVDLDEFPLGQYCIKIVGHHIDRAYRTEYPRSNGLCHYPSDIKEITEKFSFVKIYSCEHYDSSSDMIISRSVFEKRNEKGDGITLLSVGNMPVDLSKKEAKKYRINIQLFSANDSDTYDAVRTDVLKRHHKIKVASNNVNLVIMTQHGYDTQEFDLPKQKIDIGLNYGENFIPVHKKILETLNKKNSKGLVLLHGDPGTGKTHYLKFLASKIKDKKVLFIPPYLADFITSPEMTPFLIDNSNSILFIEDAERVITDRSENGSTGVSNILNITDGILSDILNIQVVATFNMSKQKIDQALLRKGRLIAEHSFKSLSIDESNRLLKHLDIDKTTDKELTLTEIYNYKEPHLVSEDPKPRGIGFGAR